MIKMASFVNDNGYGRPGPCGTWRNKDLVAALEVILARYAPDKIGDAPYLRVFAQVILFHSGVDRSLLPDLIFDDQGVLDHVYMVSFNFQSSFI